MEIELYIRYFFSHLSLRPEINRAFRNRETRFTIENSMDNSRIFDKKKKKVLNKTEMRYINKLIEKHGVT